MATSSIQHLTDEQLIMAMRYASIARLSARTYDTLTAEARRRGLL